MSLLIKSLAFSVFYSREAYSLTNCKYTKVDRLRKRHDYLYLSKYGDKYFSSYFVILARVNDKSRSRLGVTVSKKIGNARTRNRIKRVIREYFRCYIKETLKSDDINVIARKGIGSLVSTEIFNNLDKTFGYIISVRSGL